MSQPREEADSTSPEEAAAKKQQLQQRQQRAKILAIRNDSTLIDKEKDRQIQALMSGRAPQAATPTAPSEETFKLDFDRDCQCESPFDSDPSSAYCPMVGICGHSFAKKTLLDWFHSRQTDVHHQRKSKLPCLLRCSVRKKHRETGQFKIQEIDAFDPKKLVPNLALCRALKVIHNVQAKLREATSQSEKQQILDQTDEDFTKSPDMDFTTCPRCHEPFSADGKGQLAPIVGACGHTWCLSCCYIFHCAAIEERGRKLKLFACPDCHQPGAFHADKMYENIALRDALRYWEALKRGDVPLESATTGTTPLQPTAAFLNRDGETKEHMEGNSSYKHPSVPGVQLDSAAVAVAAETAVAAQPIKQEDPCSVWQLRPQSKTVAKIKTEVIEIEDDDEEEVELRADSENIQAVAIKIEEVVEEDDSDNEEGEETDDLSQLEQAAVRIKEELFEDNPAGARAKEELFQDTPREAGVRVKEEEAEAKIDFDDLGEPISCEGLFTLWEGQGEVPVLVYRRHSDDKIVLRYPTEGDDSNPDEYEGHRPNEKLQLAMREGNRGELFDGSNGTLLATDGEIITIYKGSRQATSTNIPEDSEGASRVKGEEYEEPVESPAPVKLKESEGRPPPEEPPAPVKEEESEGCPPAEVSPAPVKEEESEDRVPAAAAAAAQVNEGKSEDSQHMAVEQEASVRVKAEVVEDSSPQTVQQSTASEKHSAGAGEGTPGANGASSKLSHKRSGGDNDNDNGPPPPKKRKKNKDAAKKPANACAIFSRTIGPRVKEQNPEAEVEEITNIILAMYNSLSDDERVKWEKKAEGEQQRYERYEDERTGKEMAAYNAMGKTATDVDNEQSKSAANSLLEEQGQDKQPTSEAVVGEQALENDAAMGGHSTNPQPAEQIQAERPSEVQADDRPSINEQKSELDKWLETQPQNNAKPEEIEVLDDDDNDMEIELPDDGDKGGDRQSATGSRAKDRKKNEAQAREVEDRQGATGSQANYTIKNEAQGPEVVDLCDSDDEEADQSSEVAKENVARDNHSRVENQALDQDRQLFRPWKEDPKTRQKLIGDSGIADRQSVQVIEGRLYVKTGQSNGPPTRPPSKSIKDGGEITRPGGDLENKLKEKAAARQLQFLCKNEFEEPLKWTIWEEKEEKEEWDEKEEWVIPDDYVRGELLSESAYKDMIQYSMPKHFCGLRYSRQWEWVVDTWGAKERILEDDFVRTLFHGSYLQSIQSAAKPDYFHLIDEWCRIFPGPDRLMPPSFHRTHPTIEFEFPENSNDCKLAYSFASALCNCGYREEAKKILTQGAKLNSDYTQTKHITDLLVAHLPSFVLRREAKKESKNNFRNAIQDMINAGTSGKPMIVRPNLAASSATCFLVVWKGFIFEPVFKRALKLSKENLDLCCGGKGEFIGILEAWTMVNQVAAPTKPQATSQRRNKASGKSQQKKHSSDGFPRKRGWAEGDNRSQLRPQQRPRHFENFPQRREPANNGRRQGNNKPERIDYHSQQHSSGFSGRTNSSNRPKGYHRRGGRR